MRLHSLGHWKNFKKREEFTSFIGKLMGVGDNGGCSVFTIVDCGE